MTGARCVECDWAVDADASDVSRAMINHYVETGHYPVERLPTDDSGADESIDGESVDERRSSMPEFR